MRAWFASCLLLPAIVSAAPFDGTWVTRVSTVKITGKPTTYLVADGSFECGDCAPGLKIKADGTDQPVSGHAYYDTASAKVIDVNRVQFKTSAAGKPVSDQKFAVAEDGKTMTDEYTSYDGPTPATAKFLFTRGAPAVAGAHALSGAWLPDPANSSLPPEFLTVTFVQSKTRLKLSLPNGQSYDAAYDGQKYPIVGDPGKTVVSLKRFSAHKIQETDSRDGNTTDVILYEVALGADTMDVVYRDVLHGTVTSYTADKQQK